MSIEQIFYSATKIKAKQEQIIRSCFFNRCGQKTEPGFSDSVLALNQRPNKNQNANFCPLSNMKTKRKKPFKLQKLRVIKAFNLARCKGYSRLRRLACSATAAAQQYPPHTSRLKTVRRTVF